jgi:phage major head subunit gpT-like protein
MTEFQKLIEYINQHNIGEIIFRKKFLNEIGSSGKKSFDSYRWTLIRKGYLRQCWPGQYRVLKKIPIFLNTDGETYKETPVGKVLRLFDEYTKTTKEGGQK